MARPLLEFAAHPWRDPHRDRFANLVPEAASASEPFVRRLFRKLGVVR
jgi:hypothetical protein